MLNRIIRASLANRMAVLVIAGMLLIYGVIVTLRTEVDIFPDLNAPTVVVMTEAAGMAPEEIEKSVTYPVETAVNGAEGVRRVRSSSTPGFSVVWVEFDWDTDVYRARQIVAEKLSSLNGTLPPGVGAPTLGPQSSILGEILIIGLTADSLTTPGELRTLADSRIAPVCSRCRGYRAYLSSAVRPRSIRYCSVRQRCSVAVCRSRRYAMP